VLERSSCKRTYPNELSQITDLHAKDMVLALRAAPPGSVRGLYHPRRGELDLRELAAVVTAVKMKLVQALLVEPDSGTCKDLSELNPLHVQCPNPPDCKACIR
jgi:hypothetical protein